MRRHHAIVRITHWVNAAALTLMVGSGLRIFNAYPAFARVGERFCCYPFEHKPIPAWLTFGGWLAGARNWHFAMMWLLVVNGLVYLGFVYLHGEWRDLVPRRHDPRDAWQMVRFYLFLRRDHPHQGKHNTLQKLAYFAMLLVALLAVLSGLAIWKPVQLHPLSALFGGFVWARYIHFLAMLLIVLMVLVHVFMVLSVDPYSLRSMITGGYDPALAPEARNARPFYHLRRRWARRQQATPSPLPPAAHPASPAPPGPAPSAPDRARDDVVAAAPVAPAAPEPAPPPVAPDPAPPAARPGTAPTPTAAPDAASPAARPGTAPTPTAASKES